MAAFAVWRLWAMTFMPFYFDHVTGLHDPALYLFQNGLTHLIYPPSLVAEPFLLHLLLAMIWKIVGYSLWSSHLFVTTAVLGAVFQIGKLVQKLATPQAFPWLLTLVLSEAAWIGQSIQLSPDLFVVFFSCWAINAALDGRRISFSIALLLLSMTSIRGILTASGIGIASLADLIWVEYPKTKFRWKAFCHRCWHLLPAIIAVTAYFLARKIETGYFYFNPNFRWIEERHIAGWHDLLTNCKRMGFRLLIDNGHCILWLALTTILIAKKNSFKQILGHKTEIITQLICICLILVPVMLLTTNPFNTRYFLVIFLLFTLWVGSVIWEYTSLRKAKIWIGILVIGFWGSHLVVQPLFVAQSWDSTLAIIPYFDQKKALVKYFHDREIPLNQVGFNYAELSEYPTEHSKNDPLYFDDQAFERNRYVVISRIQNPTESTYKTISNEWMPIADLSKQRLEMVVYARKNQVQ